jgi:hypothetical protein
LLPLAETECGLDCVEQVLKLSAILARHLLSLQKELLVARLVGCSPLLCEKDITMNDVVGRWVLFFKLTEAE